MKNAEINARSGFSILELLIVLVILVVLTTVAIASFGSAKVDLQRQAIAREFKVYLERARFDSVKRRATAPAEQANLVLNSATSFTAQIDFNEDRVLSPEERRLVDFTQRAATRIVVSNTGISYPITIRFNQRGNVTATDSLGAAVSPVLFTICSSANCGPTSPDRTVIALSSSGTVAVLRNGQSPSVAPTPVISNSTPTINCYILITNSNTSCSL